MCLHLIVDEVLHTLVLFYFVIYKIAPVIPEKSSDHEHWKLRELLVPMLNRFKVRYNASEG